MPRLFAFSKAPLVGELLALQDSGAWFPFVRAWSVQLLVEARLLAKAREVAGVEDDADANAELLLQWRDAVLKFADVTRPALFATRNTLQLEAFHALVAGLGI